MSISPLQAQISPPNPPEPQSGLVTYPLNVTCTPQNAANCSGSGRYKAGQSVTINTSAKGDYVFDHWTLNGELYEPNTMKFNFVMIDKKVEFVAHYRYEPANPSEPTPLNKARLYLSCSPDGVASFNQTSGQRIQIGSIVNLYVYPNQGYKFLGWYENGILICEQKSLRYTMPSDNSYLVASFAYSPDNPQEPESEQTDVNLTPNEDVVGDLNGDEFIDALDLRYLVKIILGQQDEIESADINNNGIINIGDIAKLIELMHSMQ